MALTLLADLKHYENYFRLGYIEGLTYRVNILNSQSAGVIRASSEFTTGMEKQIAFFEDFGTITRRDITVDTAQTPEKITREKYYAFKTFWKYVPNNFQISAFKTADGMTPEEVYIMIGRKLAEKKIDYVVKQALMIASAAIGSGGTSTTKDYTTPTAENFTVDKIPEALALWGDRASSLKALVMHSAVYFPMVKDQMVNFQFDSGSGLMLYGGTPATFGLPVIVTDNPELAYTSGDNTFYKTLLLSDGAVTINDNGNTTAAYQTQIGNENLKELFQAEGDIWNEVKGYKYIGSDRAENPSDANLMDSDNWVKWTNTYKDTAGLLIKSKGSVADAAQRVLTVRLAS